ncbi:hypothetical protein [Paenibacillus melissococcoides]|nr:hypothetical protein [Paenibacillus melissococcoides]
MGRIGSGKERKRGAWDNSLCSRLDENETWRRVEERLESAMLYKRFGFIRREAKVTATYSDMPRSNTNVTSDQTGDLSTYNVDREEKLQREYEQVMRAVGQLSDTQREIIEQALSDR